MELYPRVLCGLRASLLDGQSRRVGQESFHIADKVLGKVSFSVEDRLVGSNHDRGKEILQAFGGLGRLLGPVVDLAQVVVKDHSEPNAAVVVGLVSNGLGGLVGAFLHSQLEFGPVFENELVQHERLFNGLGHSLGMCWTG